MKCCIAHLNDHLCRSIGVWGDSRQIGHPRVNDIFSWRPGVENPIRGLAGKYAAGRSLFPYLERSQTVLVIDQGEAAVTDYLAATDKRAVN